MSFNGASFFTDHPSTSSLFSPSSRRSRAASRDSRSSKHEREKFQAEFHEIESKSKGYTSFPAFNLPPSPPRSAETKGIVSGIQEGITGFCSRFIKGKYDQNVGDRSVEQSPQQLHAPKTPISPKEERASNSIRDIPQPAVEDKGTPKSRVTSDVSSDSFYAMSPPPLRITSSSSASKSITRDSPNELPSSEKNDAGIPNHHLRDKPGVPDGNETGQEEQLRDPFNPDDSDPMLTTSNGVQSPSDQNRGSDDDTKTCIDGDYANTSPAGAKLNEDSDPSTGDDQIPAQRASNLIEQVFGLRRFSKPTGATDQPRRLLHEEYWMKDENANDCFLCGAHFSPFRRKHHCRTCGQVLDYKCTSKISGATFGQDLDVLVCKKCEQRIYDSEYDSSDYYSNDETSSVLGKHGSSDRLSSAASGPSTMQHRYDSNSSLRASISMDRIASSRRLTDSSHRRSTILDSDNSMAGIPRPTSSRSGASTSNGRSHSLHRPHKSRPKVVRNFKPDRNDRPPFQHRHGDDLKSKVPFSVSVIDQDLAEYMSVDDSDERRT